MSSQRTFFLVLTIDSGIDILPQLTQWAFPAGFCNEAPSSLKNLLGCTIESSIFKSFATP